MQPHFGFCFFFSTLLLLLVFVVVVVVVLFVDLLLLDDWFTGVVVVCDLFWGCGDEGVGRVVGASTAAAAFGLDGEDEGFD